MAIRVPRHEPAGGDGRRVDARAANDRIAEKARRLQFRSRVPMVCECSAGECRTVVMVALDEYEEIRRDADSFLIAPGHALEASHPQRETADYEIRRVAREPRNGDGDRNIA